MNNIQMEVVLLKAIATYYTYVMHDLLLTIHLHYTQLVSSMNNMQMEVVLLMVNNSYIRMYLRHAWHSIPCQPKQYKSLHLHIVNIHEFYETPRLIQRLLTML